MTEHQHSRPTYSLNDKLVCDSCALTEDLGKNECHHLCHQIGKDNCNRCSQFHRS